MKESLGISFDDVNAPKQEEPEDIETSGVVFGDNYIPKQEEVTVIENKGETHAEKLSNLVQFYSSKINKVLGEDIINSEGEIDMTKGFKRTKEGGLYKKEDIKKDQQYINDHKMLFAGIMDIDEAAMSENDYESMILKDNEHTQKFLREERACETKEDMIARYEKEHSNDYGVLLESALSINFNRVLMDEYFITKASAYDDYKNGIDYVIVNKKTGVIACGFDAVNDDIRGERFKKKVNKKRREAEQGGSEIKYGITIDNYDEEEGRGDLVKTGIKNIPTFCLQLSRKDLEGLLCGMNFDLDDNINEVGLETFDKILESLKEQNQVLKRNKKVGEEVMEKVIELESAITDMERIRQTK